MQTVNGEPNHIYDEEVFTNCTVIQQTDVLTGAKTFIWWDNTNPTNTYQQEEE